MNKTATYEQISIKALQTENSDGFKRKAPVGCDCDLVCVSNGCRALDLDGGWPLAHTHAAELQTDELDIISIKHDARTIFQHKHQLALLP